MTDLWFLIPDISVIGPLIFKIFCIFFWGGGVISPKKTSAQGLLLTVYPVITPGSLRGQYGLPGIKLRSARCKASAPVLLFCTISLCYFSGPFCTLLLDGALVVLRRPRAQSIIRIWGYFAHGTCQVHWGDSGSARDLVIGTCGVRDQTEVNHLQGKCLAPLLPLWLLPVFVLSFASLSRTLLKTSMLDSKEHSLLHPYPEAWYADNLM